jgi:chromosome segregation ATPase
VRIAMERWSNDMKFTDAEAVEIMATAHAHIARWRAENRQRRNGGDRFVTKTLDHARVDPVPAPNDVDGIDAGIRSVLEIAGEAHGRLQRDVQAALRKRDDQIKDLRRQIKLLRDEIGLERGLANLKAEVDQARQQAREREFESLQRELGTLRNEIELKLNLKSELAAARVEVEELRQRAPSFEHQLNGLQGQIEKVQKTTSRLRAEHSILEYQQKQLDAEQQKNRREVTLTAVKLTTFGEQTREVLQRLQENGFDLVGVN